MAVTKAFPARFREALARSGITGAAIAKQVGVSPPLVSLWLKGDRSPSEQQITAVARALRLERSWLQGIDDGMANTSVEVSRVWSFRPTPQDGGRDYGNANVLATPPDIATLVRETGQNSVDAGLVGGGAVALRYTVIELSTTSTAFSAFADALKLDDLLARVKRAAATDSKLGTRLLGGLERLEGTSKILLLRIDDYGTTGLYGSETSGTEPSPFAALVRNNLDSSKRTTTAGGSFGVGKAVVWRCSDLSTVVFASQIAPGFEPHTGGYRFIAKSELTWHEMKGEAFAGPGWLTAAEPPDQSLVVDETFLDRAQMGRHHYPDDVDSNRSSGTSMLVVGFRDPEAQGPTDPGEVAETIARAAARNFWPAIQRGKLSVMVEAYSDERLEKSITVPTSEHVAEYFDILRRNDAGEITEALAEVGDVVRLALPLTIPATKPGAKGIDPFEELVSNAILLVRLAGSDDTADAESNKTEMSRVALIRGRGMVVKYWRRENIVVGAQPFQAAVLVGEAAGMDAPQTAAEQFFRLAEPPAHDDWRWNDELREKYERGAKVKLEALFEHITSALRKVVMPPQKQTDDGPSELKRLLQLDATPAAVTPVATIRSFLARIVDGRWIIEADIMITERTKPWAVTPRLWIRTEDSSSLRIPWETIEALPPDSVKISNGEFVPDIATRRFRFRGISEQEVDGIRVSRCRAQLDISVQPRKE